MSLKKGWALRKVIPSSLLLPDIEEDDLGRVMDLVSRLRSLTLDTVVENEEVVQVQGDPVQHDGGDNLVHTEAGLQPSGNASPDGSGGYGAEEHEGDMEYGGHLNKVTRQGSGQCAYDKLTFRTDIKQSRLKGERPPTDLSR